MSQPAAATDSSVNCTVSGASPAVTSAEKAATGAPHSTVM